MQSKHTYLHRIIGLQASIGIVVAAFSANIAAAREDSFDVTGFRSMVAIKKFDSMKQHAFFFEKNWFQSDGSTDELRVSGNLTAALGWIEQYDSAHAFVSIGPSWQISPSTTSDRFLFEVGLNPTLLSGSRFHRRDLGGWFHFTSHVATHFVFGKQRQQVVTLRIQHISNGGLNRTNPGVDFIGIEYRWQGSSSTGQKPRLSPDDRVAVTNNHNVTKCRIRHCWFIRQSEGVSN